MMLKKKKKLRILQLPIIALNQCSLFSQALRSLGHTCDYLLYDLSKEDVNLHKQCDINLGLTDKNYWQRFKTITRFVRNSIHNYDIYHFHSGRTFVPLMAFSRWSFLPNGIGKYFDFLDFIDLPYLKYHKKKMVFHFWGCDIRDPDVDSGYNDSACLVCPTHIKENHCNHKLKNKTDRLTFKYGDARLASGDLNVCYKDFLWIGNAIDTNYWKPLPFKDIPKQFQLEKNQSIKIYHSFSKAGLRNDVKGTQAIKNAVSALQEEGHKIELLYFNDIPHDQIRFYQMQADIVIDQLKAGHYGNTGVECLSMGKPVICHIRNDVEPLMPEDHPIVKATTANIKSVLEKLIVDKQNLAEIGKKSREFAVKHHDFAVIGKKLEDIYYSFFLE